MACELCEHCQNPMSRDDKIMIREGFSYHERCHKCYVCSETNLLNAEVFKGVLFCSSCAQRIFQGCSTARRTKTLNTGRRRRTRSRSHRREREAVRGHDRKIDSSRDGVIELARLVGSNTDSEDLQDLKQKKPSKLPISDHTLQVEGNKHVEDCFYFQTVDRMKRDSSEMGTTTDVTQELLVKINCIVPELYEEKNNVKPCTPPTVPQRRRHYTKKEIYEPRNKPSCSDLRIAELGVSTEIANMALRKNSEVPVIIRSDTRFKGNTSYTLSVVNLTSDKSGEGSDFVDSAYSTIEESGTSVNVMDRRLGSILKMPLTLFKKNILNRSSLVSVLMSAENGRSANLFRKIKQMLHEEVVEHQVRGLKRLYSTINRRNKPYKLGWVDLFAKVSRDSNFCTCSYGKRCRHFRNSHSYRCMRAQVMKLAGPTTSELAVYRNKIKRFMAPQFIINMLTYNKNLPALKLSAACQKSCSNNT